MGVNHWYDIYEKSVENPENVIEVLLDSQQVKHIFFFLSKFVYSKSVLLRNVFVIFSLNFAWNGQMSTKYQKI